MYISLVLHLFSLNSLHMAAHSSPVPRSHSPIYSANSNKASSTYSNSSTPRLTVEGLLNLLNDKVDFVPFTVDHDNFEESSLQLLQLVFPDWFVEGSKHLKLAQCTDGITNKRKYGCYYRNLYN